MESIQQSRIRMSFCVNVIGYVCLARDPSFHWQDGPNVSRNRNVGQTEPIIVAADWSFFPISTCLRRPLNIGRSLLSASFIIGPSSGRQQSTIPLSYVLCRP